VDQSTNDPVKLKAGGTGPMAHPPNLSWHEQTNVFLPPFTASIVVFSRYADTHTHTLKGKEKSEPFFLFTIEKYKRKFRKNKKQEKRLWTDIFQQLSLICICLPTRK
jgi:hypothetical protein